MDLPRNAVLVVHVPVTVTSACLIRTVGYFASLIVTMTSPGIDGQHACTGTAVVRNVSVLLF